MYDNKTKIIFGHYLKKFIGRDMTDFRDIKGRSPMDLDSAILSKNKIGFSEIHFNKPDNENEEFPKITCITKFEPLDLVLGLGEYLDVIENQTKEYVLKRFSNSQYNKNDNYLVILDIHNTKGGDDFATVLLNSNSPHLVGKKVSDQDKDVKGNKFRNDFLNLVMKEGEGYSKYWYKKPSTQTPAMKISYFLFQKDWNWIIASGFYYEDLEKQIAIMKESIVSHTNETIHKTLVWVALFSLLAIVIAALVSFRIDNTIKKYTNAIIDYEDNKRKQEQLLIQQSKMAAMGEMLGNIAHQWRQPLSAISTASTGAKLQKEMDCLSDQQLNSALDAINNSAQYLSKTIDDFRGFFNPNNYKLNEFNILDILTKALKLVDAQFTAKDIEIIKDIENYKLLTIENELIQVLINILNNAKDVLITKEKENRLIFINIYQKDNISYIEIKDNAGGIKEEIINRVFEPYFTTKHQSKGTGIGLYMSHEIVTKHLNGKISVCNENYIYKDVEYMGAKFTVEMS